VDVWWGVETEKPTFAGTLEVSQENSLSKAFTVCTHSNVYYVGLLTHSCSYVLVLNSTAIVFVYLQVFVQRVGQEPDCYGAESWFACGNTSFNFGDSYLGRPE